MSLTQTAFATLLILGFLGLVAATAVTIPCPGKGLSLGGVMLYGCR